MFRLLLPALLIPLAAAHATERWETLPPTPAPAPASRSGHAEVNGIRLYYAVSGHGTPVMLLHG